MNLSHEELVRYQRQVIIPGVGEEGQARLKDARVMVAGLGGLGSISSTYLVAAGVGHITVVDCDQVELGNLNRQIIHSTADLEKWKTDSAALKLKALNPHCRIQALREDIRQENVIELLGDCSVMVDGGDNLEVRRALNFASVRKGIPLIYGGVREFHGMITTFVPGETACFECIFANMTLADGPKGVFGPVAGVVASLQVLEVIKIILGMEGLLKGRLLRFSAIDMTFKETRIERLPECAVCAGFEESKEGSSGNGDHP